MPMVDSFFPKIFYMNIKKIYEIFKKCDFQDPLY